MTDDIENRLTRTLDATADGVPDTAPPSFSWQTSAQTSRLTPAPAPAAGTRHRGRYAIAGLAAAAVAAAIVVATLPTGHHAPAVAAATTGAAGTSAVTPPVPVDARSLLLAAAHTRLQSGDLPLAAGQFRWIRTVGPAPSTGTLPAAGSTAAPTTVPAPAGSYTLDELWVPKDETHTWLRRVTYPGDPAAGAPMVFSGRCGDLYAHTQDGPKGDACTRPGSFDDPTPAFVAALPNDAGALYAQLRAWAKGRLNPDKVHDVDFAMFTGINDLLSAGFITSDHTSTLYDVLARIPGIEVVDGATNARGVTGTGFRLSTVLGHGTDRDTMTIIVDRVSGDYLGYGEKADGIDYLDAVSVGVSDELGVAGR